jgi:glutamate 5-kinase
MGYKSIPKRLSRAVEAMASEGSVAKVATGGLRTKIALVVRQ